MNQLESLVREKIKALTPYSSARDEYAETEAGDTVLLDANENSLGSVLGNSLNRYPDPYQKKLKTSISDMLNVSSESLFLGNGSDEAIDLLLRIFCEPGVDCILTFPPTYGMYKVSADINSISIIESPLDEKFEISVEEALRLPTKNTKLALVCSPNNPTGNAIPLEQIEALLKSFRGYVVVDEAYVDFCPEKSALRLFQKYENLIVLRTFSKAWGLAGIRLGIAIAQKEVIALLNKVKSPYNISKLTQDAALKALTQRENMRHMAQVINAQREQLSRKLQSLSIVEKVYPSDANFILAKFKNSKLAFDALTNARVIVRDRSSVKGCEHCLRITIGSQEENDMVCSILASKEVSH